MKKEFFNKEIRLIRFHCLVKVMRPQNSYNDLMSNDLNSLVKEHSIDSWYTDLVQRFIVTLRCAVNVTTSSFQHFP